MDVPDPMRRRLRIHIQGAVQGVGFRPFVYRTAQTLGLDGWVRNAPDGVIVEVEGALTALDRCVAALRGDAPPPALVHTLEVSRLEAVGYCGFSIRESDESGSHSAVILPDIATCSVCLGELFNPSDRRFRYPFLNCTHCGPRYTIIESLPYDRHATSMRCFTMCGACRAEYEDPSDRRFHAQPNACPDCGPRISLFESRGGGSDMAGAWERVWDNEALTGAVQRILDGQILAVKGLGGFHLVCDATNDEAIIRLRKRKHREEKPFAVMVPSIEWAQRLCSVSAAERAVLQSGASPIVLLEKHEPGEASRADDGVITPCREVAPGNPYLGIMLPYTPLHHLLLHDVRRPLVATSGNLAEEPICKDEEGAVQRLAGIADAFLVHDRRIVHHADDSIVRVVAGREQLLRRARGFAPLPVFLPRKVKHSALAVGGHLKNTVALATGSNVFVSPHIGNLENAAAFDSFRATIAHFMRVYAVTPDIVAYDLHPDYPSTRYALSLAGPRKLGVQHHAAHVYACMLENDIRPPVLGVSWDGTGYGTDGTVWGGEWLRIDSAGRYARVASFIPFALPGGERAVREPCRSALGMLVEAGWGAEELSDVPEISVEFSAGDLETLVHIVRRGIHSPRTSSAGRIFDAIAALCGLACRNTFEGQAAMNLEWAAMDADEPAWYDVPLRGEVHGTAEEHDPREHGEFQADEAGVAISPVRVSGDGGTDCANRMAYNGGADCPGGHGVQLDWRPLLFGVLDDRRAGVPVAKIARGFHEALARAIVGVAQREQIDTVVLSGGCFQNRLLTERTIDLLESDGFRAVIPQRIPPNDGGIAPGQIAAAFYQGEI